MHKQITLEYELELTKRVAQAPVEREHLGDIMRRLGVLAGVRLSKSDSKKLAERIKAMMSEEILKESTYVQALIEKWEPVILAKKEAEGEVRGMHKIVQVALEGRFGMLSADLLAALEAASPETLEDIAAHISTDTLEQARSRLGLS